MASRFWVGGTGTWDSSDTTHWASSSGGAGGQSVPGSGDTVTFDGSSGGGTVTVNHASNTITSLTMGAFTGTLDFATNDNNISMATFSGSGSGARTLNMGDGTWTITGTTGTVWDCTTVTNFTLNSNASKILFSATPTGARLFLGGAKTYNQVEINDGGTVAACGFSFSSAVITTFTPTLCRWLMISSGSSLNITNAFSWNGTSSAPVFLSTASATTGTGTLNVSGAATLTWAVIYGITKGGAGSITATNSFDGRGNTSVTITGPSTGGSSGVIGG